MTRKEKEMKRKKVFKKKKQVDDDIHKSLKKSFSKTVEKYSKDRIKKTLVD